MKWSFEKVLDSKNHPLEDEKTLDVEDSLKSRYPETVLAVSPIHVTAVATPDDGDVHVEADVTGNVTVPSSRSLEPTDLPLNFHISETYVVSQAAFDRYDNEEVVIKLSSVEEMIDFDKSVEDNIIVHIPMHVLSPEEQAGKAMPKGDGWEVVSEDDFVKPGETPNVDPRLAALKNFKPSDDDKK